jgi:hypothetical protein
MVVFLHIFRVCVVPLRRVDPPSKEVKLNLSLCLIKHYAMMTYVGVEVYLHHS